MNQFEGEIPILGVCLGFQFIYEYYGGIIHGLKAGSRSYHDVNS